MLAGTTFRDSVIVIVGRRDTGLDVVTGAFGFTGRAITARLVHASRRVRTLTGHPNRPNPFSTHIEVERYHFDDLARLTGSLEGVTTLYNTYWIRFAYGNASFEEAIRNSRKLFVAAKQASVQRIVHISITNPDEGSSLPYFRGKDLVERQLKKIQVPHSIIRPTVVFGSGDVLVNNIAWLLRRVPIFTIPGFGDYRVRPVHVEDVARLCVENAQSSDDLVLNAVGPEILSFAEMVRLIREAVGSRALLLDTPVLAIPALTYLLGATLRDVLLTRDELRGLMQNLVTVEGPATGHISFSEWVRHHGAEIGKHYASELQRHFRTA
jgi:NADH dehydrogenase